jgi:hypothetical protein
VASTDRCERNGQANGDSAEAIRSHDCSLQLNGVPLGQRKRML